MRHVYIAAPYARKSEARLARKFLRAVSPNISVRSSWLDHNYGEHTNPTVLRQEARNDLADIDACDTLILLNFEGWETEGSGGKHFETGYAFSRGMLVIVVGQRSNVFHHLPSIYVVESLADAVELLDEKL